ncbi:uncharacterized protein LOC131688414 [Topomyia yanbarensis]|uniref:uncharacterized protein LOC131688414 n=1 Tax=Topomyia yanbarensis TaxID=2498891 RepID=UPI00273B3AA6|nr:uncharacterized protein LOC131688414 [Topomyia yanbarensis]
MLSYKLDPATLRAWEERSSQDEEVIFDDLVDFLYQRVRILKSVASDLLQRAESAQAKVAGTSVPPKKSFHSRIAANAVASEGKSSAPSCLACSESHYLFQCPAFANMAINQRPQKSNPPTLPNVGNAGPATPQVSLPVHSYSSTVLLETVALHVVDDQGKIFEARALLDSASMSNFMSKKLANLLSNRQSKVDIDVVGIGQSMRKLKRTVNATVRSRIPPFSTKLEFLVIDKPTTDLPTMPVPTSSWKFPDINLADPQFHTPSQVDVVIGGETYWELHTGKKMSLGPGQPQVIETLFGWTVSGPAPHNSSIASPRCFLTATDDRLEVVLQRFWEMETIVDQPTHSTTEKRCEDWYTATTIRDSSGRYKVRLPKVDDPEIVLSESRAIATRRLLILERRLERDTNVKSAYHLFMDEYERLGHMKRLNEPIDDCKEHCYLPHHPVFKLSSTTTKTRVVFDASCKTTSGFSLNDRLLVGPVVQHDLLSLIMRFRIHAIALIADIEKMYRQVLIHPEDQPLQRILWRTNATDPIATYELQTVTYGTASAPYLATKTLQQLSHDAGYRFPVAAEPVMDDFYVDDFLSGAADVKTAQCIQCEVSSMLDSAGFSLKKWASNSVEVLEGVPEEDRAIQPFFDLQDEQSVSTLGLIWEPKTDTFRFNVQLPLPAAVLTKRNVMSYIAQIFDPLGLVGPTVMKAKLFMQCLWALKSANNKRYEWDQPLPQKLQNEWKQFHTTIDLLRQLKIPRFVPLINAVSIEFHFFVDASWKHIAGVDNHADDISRGLSPPEILNSLRWWNGTPWLSLPPESWPVGALPTDDSLETTKESRKIPIIAMTVTQSNFNDFLFNRYSDYTKLRRTTAYCLRYLQKLHDRVINRRIHHETRGQLTLK